MSTPALIAGLSVLGVVVVVLLLPILIACLIRFKNHFFTWGRYTLDEDLSGNLAVVTGATAGLGLEISRELARRGAHLVWGARNMNKAGKLKEAFEVEYPGCQIDVLKLDLTSLSSAGKFAADVAAKFESAGVDLLFCNAGMGTKDETARTDDGYEIHFGVNYLAHFVIIDRLMKTLLKSSSMTMRWGKLNFSEPDSFLYSTRNDPAVPYYLPTAYPDSKLANALLNRELASRYEGLNIAFHATCPGFCDTELNREGKINPVRKMLTAPLMFAIRRSAQRGACNIMHAAFAEGLQSGTFYRECKPAQAENAQVEELMRRGDGELLWEISQKCVDKAASSSTY